MGLFSSIFSGIASFVLNALSALLVLGGAYFFLSGNIPLAALLLLLGCIALIIAELFDLYSFYDSLAYQPINFGRATIDAILFGLTAFAPPALVLIAYFFIFREPVLLVIAITSGFIAVVKLIFRLVRLALARMRFSSKR